MGTEIHQSFSSSQLSILIYEKMMDRKASGGASFTISGWAVGSQPQGKPCKLSALCAYWDYCYFRSLVIYWCHWARDSVNSSPGSYLLCALHRWINPPVYPLRILLKFWTGGGNGAGFPLELWKRKISLFSHYHPDKSLQDARAHPSKFLWRTA